MPLVDRFIDETSRGGVRFEKVSAILGEDLLVTVEADGGHRMRLAVLPKSQTNLRYEYQFMITADTAPDGYYHSMLIKRSGKSIACAERAAKDILGVWGTRMKYYQRRVKAAAILEAAGLVGYEGRYALPYGSLVLNEDGKIDTHIWQGMPAERVLMALGMENTYLDDEEDEEAA